MDPFSGLISLILAIYAGSFLVGACITLASIALTIFLAIWWFQTLLHCLEHETGSDKTTYVLIIVMLGPLGALVYRLVRTSPDDGPLYSFRPPGNKYSPLSRRPTQRRTGYSSGQVALIAVGSSLVGIVVCCGSLLAFSAWYDPPLPTRAAPQTTPGPSIFPTSFSFDPTPTVWTLLTATPDAAAIMTTLDALSTQNSELMQTSTAYNSP